MTSPNCLPPGASDLAPPPAMAAGIVPLQIGLEQPLHPGHLALIAARDGAIAAGPTLVLQAPGASGDGFAALARGDYDLILSSPLQVLRPEAQRFEALGCLMVTRGSGVLVREDRIGKLRAGETIRVASPFSDPVSNGLCRRTLQSWAGSEGFAVAETQIAVEPAGFGHVDNLQAGFDAAWLAVANVDEIQARRRGPAARLLSAEAAGLPGFSALELVARKARGADEIARHEALIAALEEATPILRADAGLALRLWRVASGDQSEEAEDVVQASLKCLKAPLDRAPGRWRALKALLQET
jgi:NMT1/THI5 like protein